VVVDMQQMSTFDFVMVQLQPVVVHMELQLNTIELELPVDSLDMNST
jgi:hypothetical protein